MLKSFKIRKWPVLAMVIMALSLAMGAPAHGQEAPLQQGNAAYAAGRYAEAAERFAGELKRAPSAEAWRNLGNAEWQRGQRAEAVLAWERARWLNPADGEVAASLRFARNTAQLTVPPLRWWEVFSSSLSPNAWAGLAAGSFWGALLAAVILPAAWRRWRSAWSQSLAAFGLGLFLLALTGAYGVQTRARLGVILPQSASLLQAPAAHAPVVFKLNGGDVVRTAQRRGAYYHVVCASGEGGWLEHSQFTNIVGR